VLAYDGWQTYGVSKGETLRKLDPNQAPISYALGITQYGSVKAMQCLKQ
jgi:hypothetical protein